MERKRWLLALLFAAIALSVAFFIVKGRRGMVDFEVNYEAGRRIRAGETLYRAADGHYQFKYPPFSALLYVPVSALPLDAAKAVWFILVLGSTILVFQLAFKLARPLPPQTTLLRIAPPLILAKCFLRELSLGQINALITAVCLAMILLSVNGRARPSALKQGSAGALWGIATALKPYAAVFMPYWILKKRWATLAAGGAALILAYLAPALYFGLPGNALVHSEWISSLSRSTPGLFSTQDNVSLIAMFTKWTGRPGLSGILYSASLGALAALFLVLMARGRKRKRPEVLETGLLLALIPLISPLGWDYTLLSTVLVIMLILKHFRDFSRRAKVFLGLNFAVFGLALFDLMGRSLYARYMALSVPTVNALVFVGAAAWIRLKGLD